MLHHYSHRLRLDDYGKISVYSEMARRQRWRHSWYRWPLGVFIGTDSRYTASHGSEEVFSRLFESLCSAACWGRAHHWELNPWPCQTKPSASTYSRRTIGR